MNAKLIHFIVGALTLLVFLMTGVYMKSHFPGAYEASEIVRYQYRANHIYVLMIGLINVMASLVHSHELHGWRKKVHYVGSFLVMTAPLLLITAFFIEPVKAIPQRPLTLFGVILAGAGVVSLALSHIRKETVPFLK